MALRYHSRVALATVLIVAVAAVIAALWVVSVFRTVRLTTLPPVKNVLVGLPPSTVPDALLRLKRMLEAGMNSPRP